MTMPKLPAGVTVFERGWLSCNNILFLGAQSRILVDSGYGTHAEQTVALVEAGVNGRPLNCLLNTHLHSDHCGGNAALQQRYPELQTLIPPGQADLVATWDPVALTYGPTGQFCPQFGYTGVLQAGQEMELADTAWEIHAAPGHDPHSVILFEPQSRTLISADALWENGFGVVFPELEGDDAFGDVARTLDLIERLAPRIVIPGHGAVFNYRQEVLTSARQRLDAFVRQPARHARHAAKVLLKFKLLEQQRLPLNDFREWTLRTSYFRQVRERFFTEMSFEDLLAQLIAELVNSGAAGIDKHLILNA